MFLQNRVSLDCLHDFNSKDFNPCTRPIEYFFQDIQKTVDESNLENLQIFILSARDFLYANERDMDNKTLLVYRDSAESRYNLRLQNASFLFDCCRTLTYLEKQQRAFERQIEINNKKQRPFLPEEVPDVFFKRLYALKWQHGFCTPHLSQNDCIQGYRNLYFKCSEQPIPSVLLSLLLTVYSIDGNLFSNVYAFLKYKNRRLSIEAQKQVIPLFQNICELVLEYFPNITGFEIPIFRWADIEESFCKHHNLYDSDVKIVKEYFEQYRNQNDLSKKQESELLKYSYGGDIRSLAKLCNLNTYITMKCLPTGSVPAKAKKPLQQLYSGELLPVALKGRVQGDFDRYFGDLYKTIPGNPDFSYIALLRYFHLPLDSLLTIKPDFFPDIEDSLVAAVTQYNEKLRRKYQPDILVFEFPDEEEFVWLNRRRNARIQCRLKNIPDRYKYTRHKKLFANQVLQAFSEQDYREFIKEPENFSVHFFPRYLNHFCEEHSLTDYSTASDQEACFLEDEAFSTILDAVQDYLLNNVSDFWHRAIARELYK